MTSTSLPRCAAGTSTCTRERSRYDDAALEPRPMTSSRSAAPASGRRKVGTVRHGALLVAGAAILWFGIAGSVAAATPIYTDWSAPVNLGPTVNSAASEAGPALSGDGLSLYFASDRQGRRQQRHLGLTASDGERRLGNTGESRLHDQHRPSADFVPSFSTDGHWMFFASARPGGFGGAPISTSPTARTSTTISAGRRRPTSARTSTPQRPRTGTATSTTEASRSCSSAATG